MTTSNPSITATTLRNIIAILGSIDRHEIEEQFAITEVDWHFFQDNPYWKFLRMSSSEQDSIARIVSARMAGGEGVVKDLYWQEIADPWPMEGMRDVEAITEIGTYTISADQPALGGIHYLWLAGNETDEHDSEHRNMVEAKAAAQADFAARSATQMSQPASLLDSPLAKRDMEILRLRGEMQKAAEAGWNACRRQVYGLSEDYIERTHELKGSDTVEGNFYRGQYDVAKSFAKAFSAFEALECDYFKQIDFAALSTATPPVSARMAEGVETVDYKSLFEECQDARDEVGFLGSVPDCIRRLAAEAAPCWQDISTAPKTGEEFIARTGPEWAAFSCSWDGEAFVHYDRDDGIIHYGPKQWTPMPSATPTPADTALSPASKEGE